MPAEINMLRQAWRIEGKRGKQQVPYWNILMRRLKRQEAQRAKILNAKRNLQAW
jgi:hypothetical protein